MPKIAPEASETVLKRMMADGKRTKRTVAALGNPRGFCVRLNPGKVSSAPCYFTYRMEKGAPFQWLPLGNYPDLSLEDLREAAHKALKLKKAGKDPRHEAAQERKREAQATAAAKAAPTMAEACALYFAYAAKRENVKASTEAWSTALINRVILPYWGERLVADVTHEEVDEWHGSEAMREHSSQADAALRVLSKIFNLTLKKTPPWRSDNPAKGVTKLVTSDENTRKRILNKAERQVLERTLRAMEAEKAIEPAAAGAIRALQLSAMRLQECLTLRWDEITWDEDTTDEKSGEVTQALTGWIEKDNHKSSRRKGAKLIAITPQLGKIIRAQPKRAGSPWVFSSPFTPPPDQEIGHFVGLQKVWERIRTRVTKDEAALVKEKKKKPGEAVNIEDAHLHDLRRTALSITYGDTGQTIEALAEVAGHASTATTKKHYAHLETEKKRAAAEKIASKIAEDMDAQ